MVKSDDPTKRVEPGPPTEPTARVTRWRVVTVTESGRGERWLPPVGRLTVGRSEQADVQLDDAAAGRLHAQLIITPEGVRLRDLGSVNGTSVRGRKLEPNEEVALSVGDAVELGESLLVLQEDRLTTDARPWTLLTHFQLLDAIDDCKPPFSVVRLQIKAPPGVAQNVLSTELQPADTVASFGPGCFEVLVPRLGADGAKQLLQDLTVKLLAAGAERVRSGFATAPRDGTEADELLAACSRPPSTPAPGTIVRDDAMVAIHRLLDRIAPSLINVLLLGESGVGKEVLAEELHRRSKRAAGPYLKVNCGAFSEQLLASELFGHEKGAFTGATERKMGVLQAANGGTLLLDEVGEMSDEMQVKLLRALEERQITRLGGVKPEAIDARFIFATNRDLEAEVSRDAFRTDLFYRINGISIVIPPLRERVSEIEDLALKFIADGARRDDRPVPELSSEALAVLRAWHWPGNVRELRNTIDRASLLCGERAIAPADLLLGPVNAQRALLGAAAAPGPQSDAVRSAINDVERRLMEDRLKETGGNHTRAAELMGWSRRKWTERAKRYGLQKNQ